MAARAVWQRTANRYFIQEDAKRAPKLACCSSTSSLLSEVDIKPINTRDLNDTFSLPNDKSFYSNISSDSKWWLQIQPDYIHQRGLTSEQVNPSHQSVENQDGSSIDSLSKESYEFVEMGFTENYDLTKPMHTGSKPQNIKCSQNAVSRIELQNVTKKQITEVDSSKSKILEALCHSQTRAREAENAAKKAYQEKEQVIKLLFKQASQLFAYRQWIYLLQLENICYQIKNDKRDSKSGKFHKNSKKVVPAKRKRTRSRHGFGRFGHEIGKYAVVFVVGLGIVGAGLLLGWTVGWMLI